MQRLPVLAILLAVVLVVRAPAAEGESTLPTPAMSLLKQIDQGFVQVFEKVAPAVVVIAVTKKEEGESEADLRRFNFFFRDRDGTEPRKDAAKENFRLPRETRSEGSGFIVRPDGFILTNRHVIADAEKLDVRLKDGRHFTAKVVGSDDKTDVAVLKIEAKDLPIVELGDSDALRVGQLVCAIGAPFNQDYSFTCGWVSGKGRTNLLSPSSKSILYEDYIQTDAFINPGNSGGPLFDVDGKVVGMNTLINGVGRGLAFAIPSTMLTDVSTQLITNGKVRRSWLGVRIETLSENPTLRDHLAGLQEGVVVDTIEAGAPAYQSDLRPLDVITEVDGMKVSAARELQMQIVKKAVGQVVQLTVWRAGKTMSVPVTTGELPTEVTRVASAPLLAPLAGKRELLGMKLKDAAGKGALVEAVTSDTPAARAGLQIDDLISDVETKPIFSADAALEAIGTSNGLATGKGILLGVERKGKRTHAVLAASE